MIKQGLDYDPDGNYVRAWVPEISKIPGGKNSLYLKVRIVYFFDLSRISSIYLNICLKFIQTNI